MKKLSVVFLFALWGVIALGQDEPKFPPMPAAVSNNAVASLKGGFELFSLMGVGPKKNWDDVTNQVYIMTGDARWKMEQRTRCSGASGPFECRRSRSERIDRSDGRLCSG